MEIEFGAICGDRSINSRCDIDVSAPRAQLTDPREWDYELRYVRGSRGKEKLNQGLKKWTMGKKED